MILHARLVAVFLCLLFVAGAANKVAASPTGEKIVYQKSAAYTPPAPTDISYRVPMRLHSQAHKNRWTKNQVAITLHGTTGSFRMMLLPTSMGIPHPQWNFEDNRLKKDASAETQAECKKVGYKGCALEWIFPGTHQIVRNIGPITAIGLDCWGCGETDDFQYGFFRVEYRQKGSAPVVSRVSKEGWLKDWRTVVRNVTHLEDGIDLDARWQPVDCGSGMGCKVGEFFKVIDLRSSKEDLVTRVTARHEISTEEYSKFITESRQSWEIEAGVKASFVEAKASQRKDTEQTSDSGTSREVRATTETDKTESVPAGYLVIYHETIMAKGSYRPSGLFNLGTRLNPELDTAHTQWLFFANNEYGELRRFEWRAGPDGEKTYVMLNEDVDEKYIKLLKDTGFY